GFGHLHTAAHAVLIDVNAPWVPAWGVALPLPSPPAFAAADGTCSVPRPRDTAADRSAAGITRRASTVGLGNPGATPIGAHACCVRVAGRYQPAARAGSHRGGDRCRTRPIGRRRFAHLLRGRLAVSACSAAR